MTEGYITIAEAARRLGKSEKTLRRMVHSGKLDARYPVPNRAEIAIAKIEALAESRQAVQTEAALAERLAQVERKVAELEATLEKLSARAPAPALEIKQGDRKGPLIAPPLPGLPGRSDIPEGSIRVFAFARAHGIPEPSAKTQIRSGRLEAIAINNPIRPGEKERYFTREQQRQALALWTHHERFTACPDCPHSS